ncbi:P-loop containing nucleoside triphosphate hydrolase protein [Xylaria bambusicola]|uniref:P-loop containing nucleoside triphosphate hydrolase protein n=1 Tax=Xylaria bambusicola TaxID=326684 RepID=UPI002007D51F|nr:P-loop containing nucleoside triphosphate hydrolase protein [Xylaria bambusicola]KAI0512509.1 P-loop containing nucleoside triphosphate hydrolase protein [Xylaria bambusicola]
MENPSRKLIIQMSGPPGSGKSTLARLLARSIDGVVINHDLIKDFFLDSSFSFLDSARLTYRLDWALADDIIQQGRSVVVDSVCNYEEVLTRGTALAARYGYSYWYVECKVDDKDLLASRLHTREPLQNQDTGEHEPLPDSVSSFGGAGEDGAVILKKWMETSRPDNDDVLIVVDATRGPEECLNAVMKRLGSQPPEQSQADAGSCSACSQNPH